MTRKPPSPTPRPVRDLAGDALAELLRDQPMSPQKLDFAWKAAVGPALARATAVSLDGRVLRVEVAGPLWGSEIERAADGVLARLARVLGPGAVTALDVRGGVPARPRRPPVRQPPAGRPRKKG